MAKASDAISKLKSAGNPERALHSQKYFRTGPGEYGEGDVFLGVRVPVVRKLVGEFRGLELVELGKMLHSPFHEARLFALLSMAEGFRRSTESERTAIYNLYMNSTDRVNGWDLVDSSAPHIPGVYLQNREKQPLYALAVSNSLWDRRIAIIATLHFIRNNSFAYTLDISEILLNDKVDLIQKAVGWMLREVGNRNPGLEEDFLCTRYRRMPRTMLRYAVEKFDSETRNRYMKGLI